MINQSGNITYNKNGSTTVNANANNTNTNNSFYVQVEGSTGTYTTGDLYGPRILEKVEQHPELNQMHIIYRRKPNFTYTVSTVTTVTTYNDGWNYIPPQPNDKLEKEIWGVSEDGKLELFKVVAGEVIPPSYSAEQFKFDDQEGARNTDTGGSDS